MYVKSEKQKKICRHWCWVKSNELCIRNHHNTTRAMFTWERCVAEIGADSTLPRKYVCWLQNNRVQLKQQICNSFNIYQRSEHHSPTTPPSHYSEKSPATSSHWESKREREKSPREPASGLKKSSHESLGVVLSPKLSTKELHCI